jgi:hypothetical protein
LRARIDWVADILGTPSENHYPNGTVCGYFLNVTSSAPVLMSGYNLDTISSTVANASTGEALTMRALPLVTVSGRRALYDGSIHFKHIRHHIKDVIISSVAGGASGVYRNERPVAHECVLFWCVQTINSSYYWANYKEEVAPGFINTTTAPIPFNTSRTNISGESGTLTTYTENVTIEAITSNGTVLYGLSNITAFRTITVFDDIFPSFTTVQNGSTEAFLRFKNYVTQPTLQNLAFNPWLAPNNITRHMERLATAVTNAIRSSTSKEMVEGMAFSKDNFVAVRWVWLSLPLGLLLLSLVFLAATVIKTSREADVGVWKTSAIATLLYGLPDDMQRKITTSTSKGTPRAKAKELRVRLGPEMDWRVSGNLFSPVAPMTCQSRPPPGWI